MTAPQAALRRMALRRMALRRMALRRMALRRMALPARAAHARSPRRRAAALPPAASLSSGDLYGVDCYPANEYSTATGWNSDVPEDPDTARAWTNPPVYEAGSSVPQFVYGLPANLAANECARRMTSLRDAGWLDAATRDVRVQLTLLAGQVGLVATAEFSAVFTRGSLVDSEVVVRSVPLDPYGGEAAWVLAVGDAIFVAYMAYLIWRTGWRLARPCLRGRGAAACAGEALQYSRLLDMTTVAAMLAVVGLWIALCVQLSDLRAQAAAALPVTGTFFTIPSPLRAPAAAATATFASWKEAVVVMLICLTLRLYKYFSFQPRLGVVTAVAARSAGDACTHGAVFAVLVILFAVWAAVLFAPQDAGWVDAPTSLLTLIQYMMYDYDYDAQARQYPIFAAFFYVAFMLLITNLIFWMFLAILFEEYTAVRYDSHNSPTVADEAAAAAHAVARAAARALPRACTRSSCCQSRGATAADDDASPAAIASAVPFAAVARALRVNAALSRAEFVDAEDLAHALRIPLPAADCLLAEAAAVADYVMTLPAADDDEDDAAPATLAETSPAAIEARAAVLRQARARFMYGTADAATAAARDMLAQPVPLEPRRGLPDAAKKAAPAPAQAPETAPKPQQDSARLGSRATPRDVTGQQDAVGHCSTDAVGARVQRMQRLLASLQELRAGAAALATALGVSPPPPPPPPSPPGVARPPPSGSSLRIAWPPTQR